MPWIVVDARNGGVEPRNEAVEGLYVSGCKFTNFDEEPNTDPRQCEWTDSDSHLSEMSDPYPHPHQSERSDP